MADKRSFFGRPRLLPTSTASQLDSTLSSAKSANAGEVSSVAVPEDESRPSDSEDAQGLDAVVLSKIAAGFEKRTFFGRSLRGSTDSKWCAQCGEGTVKPDREACKFCGAVEWAAMNPQDSLSAADGYEEVRLSAAEPFGLVFSDDLMVQEVHLGSQAEVSGVRVGMILKAAETHSRGNPTTDDVGNTDRSKGRGRSSTTSDLSALQSPPVPPSAFSLKTPPANTGSARGNASMVGQLPPGYTIIADKNALADAVSKLRSVTPIDHSSSTSSSSEPMIGLLFAGPSGSQRERRQDSGSIDEHTASPLAAGAPTLPSPSPSKLLFSLPAKSQPLKPGATRRLSEGTGLFRGNSFGEQRSEVAAGTTAAATPPVPPPSSTIATLPPTSQRRGSGTANDFFLRSGAATRSVIMSGKGGRGGRGGKNHAGASASNNSSGTSSNNSSGSVHTSSSSYGSSSSDSDVTRESIVGSATEAAFLERRSISVPAPRFALLRENSDLLGRSSRESISGAAASSASGSLSRPSTCGDNSIDALRASVDVSKAINRRKSLASTLLPPEALQPHSSTLSQPTATPASEGTEKESSSSSGIKSENSSSHGNSSSGGGVTNSSSRIAKAPLVKSILRPALRMRSNSVAVPKEAKKHRVVFQGATLRFYGYGPGGSVPGSTKGAPLGLHGDWHEHGEVKMSVDELEALRGGDPPEEGEDEEEWDDNWRIPRQYFADEGTIPPQKRDDYLLASGVRRVSLDLMKHDTSLLLASRKANGATTVVAMIIAGFDIGEIYQLEKEDEAATVLGAWARKRRLARLQAPKPPG